MYYVYILSSRTRVLYIGVTRDLDNRLFWHRSNANPKSFTARYRVHQLVYFEEHSEVTLAIAREKELKRYPRREKEKLIEGMNPKWEDLAPVDVPIPHPDPICTNLRLHRQSARRRADICACVLEAASGAISLDKRARSRSG